MMLSMTGYGSAERADGGIAYALELRSLNNRYFKLSTKLPESLQFLEPEVEAMLRAKLGRGSLTYVLRVRNQSATAAYDINTAALENYVRSICQTPTPEGIHASVDLAALAAAAS